MSNRFQPYEEIQTEAVLRYQEKSIYVSLHFIVETNKTIHQELFTFCSTTIDLANTQQTNESNKQTDNGA